MTFIKFISIFLGWSSTIFWSFSFYPQLILNKRQRKSSGISIDFLLLNWIGFTNYSIFNSVFYLSNTETRFFDLVPDNHFDLVPDYHFDLVPDYHFDLVPDYHFDLVPDNQRLEVPEEMNQRLGINQGLASPKANSIEWHIFPTSIPLIHLSDMIFSLHAWLLCGIALTQYFYYQHQHLDTILEQNQQERIESNSRDQTFNSRNQTFNSRNQTSNSRNQTSGSQIQNQNSTNNQIHYKISRGCVDFYQYFLLLSLSKITILFLVLLLFEIFCLITFSLFNMQKKYVIALLSFTSYVKMIITLIKYIPQLVHNFQLKSTVGWSIWNIILDFSGGVCSLAQMILDCYIVASSSPIMANPVKFGLGFTSLLFDIAFFIQHHYLYPVPSSLLVPTSEQVDLILSTPDRFSTSSCDSTVDLESSLHDSSLSLETDFLISK
jgi:uncharacterized protein with PQ loop repeat